MFFSKHYTMRIRIQVRIKAQLNTDSGEKTTYILSRKSINLEKLIQQNIFS